MVKGLVMAHIWVTVCLSPEAVDEPMGALARALAPFEMYHVPPNRGVWDAWRTRGGGEGRGFYVRPGFENDPRLIHDSPRDDGFVLPTEFGQCAGGPKELLEVAVHTVRSADVLTLDGWWIEGIKDGFAFYAGCDHDDDPCEHTAARAIPPGGNEAYLEALPDSTVLARVYCHG
ncbi:hypothetical protein IU486_23175 [Streptomyces gardneri]|uniref:hypothetical protein n=1 Tax=Nocardia sputi TaxID=2943705 RepID=UPI0018938FED|nr:hypothetical protein [Nocardia sputi]MBF6167638.1 hypothetical protein [Streptomyces gardneri]